MFVGYCSKIGRQIYVSGGIVLAMILFDFSEKSWDWMTRNMSQTLLPVVLATLSKDLNRFAVRLRISNTDSVSYADGTVMHTPEYLN